MKAVVLGGTGGIGRAVARELAQRGSEVFLLGRNEAELAKSAGDLVASFGSARVGFARCDLDEPRAFGPAIAAAERFLQRIELFVVTAGSFGTQQQLEDDFEARDRVLRTNFAGTIHFCEEARQALLRTGGGTLCVISSVAGERPRKSVVLYGASKAGLSYYARGLDLRFRTQGLRTVLIQPGFVRTAMTAGLPEPPFAADPDRVARGIVRAIERGQSVAFVPRVWRLVAGVLRALPGFVLRRIER